MNEGMNSFFSRSREICPNLPDGVHEIAGYVAKRMGEYNYISSQGLALLFATVLEKEENDDFWLFPQLVDELVKELRIKAEYATTFREICKEVMGINPPIIITPKEYPENIQVAVDWWTEAVLFRDTSNMPNAFKKYFQREYTAEEVAIFKATLAENIAAELEDGGVWLGSEWTAKGILKTAGDKIGINPLLGYPDAAMMVYEKEVKITIDGGNRWETIWSNYSEEDFLRL